jgi:hypothetical protein
VSGRHARLPAYIAQTRPGREFPRRRRTFEKKGVGLSARTLLALRSARAPVGNGGAPRRLRRGYAYSQAFIQPCRMPRPAAIGVPVPALPDRSLPSGPATTPLSSHSFHSACRAAPLTPPPPRCPLLVIPPYPIRSPQLPCQDPPPLARARRRVGSSSLSADRKGSPPLPLALATSARSVVRKGPRPSFALPRISPLPAKSARPSPSRAPWLLWSGTF